MTEPHQIDPDDEGSPNTVNISRVPYDCNLSIDGGKAWLEPRQDWVPGRGWRTS